MKNIFKLPYKVRLEAFSLIEMLMALLVASLLLAALAPVMTKRLSENINVSENKKSPAYSACVPIGGSCTVPLDANIAGAIILSGGGGGGGAVPDVISTTQATLGSTVGSDNAANAATYKTGTYTITENMRDLEITLISGGAGGGGGNGTATNVAPTKQADCEPFGVYIQASYNGGKAICVSKYNPGENRDGSPALTGVTVVPANGTSSCTGGNCCWYGNNMASYNTANLNYCDKSANGIAYSGCSRTVCQWSAANKICQNWKPVSQNTNITGRAPSHTEVSAWKNSGMIIDKEGKPGKLNWDPTTGAGLQLCNYSQNLTGAPRCFTLLDKCLGAGYGYNVTQNRCHPNGVWTSTQQTGGFCWAIDIYNNANQVAAYASTIALSVRCVIDGIPSNKIYTGGGGGAGIYIKVNVPNEVLERATNATGSASLVLQAGGGGKGGAAKNTARGVSGSPSIAKITDGNGTLIWYLEIPGGTGGAGGSTTAGGASGGAGNTNNCKYLDITNSNYSTIKTGACSSFPLANVSAGEAGGTGGSSASYSSVGYGGRPKVENAFQGSRPQVPSGTSATAINGNNAGSAGGGGAGGNCYYNNGAITCGAGGYGKGGKAEAKYKKYTPGAAGGGGAAGTLIHIRNISVASGEEVKISAGNGGIGGASGANGGNGGASYAIISGTKFEVLGGGGGKAATAGNPNTNTMATAGKGGAASSISNTTKNLLSGLSKDSYNIYPTDTNSTAGSAAPVLNLINGRVWTQSTGGDGGINEITAAQASYPCGGLSTTKGSCNNISITPLAPKANDSTQAPAYFDETLLNNYPAGGTGGGGGGWMKSSGAAAGAKGMNGYVYVYFTRSGG